MEKNTLKNIFHMYWFYIVRFQDGAEQCISRNKLIYEKHILSYHENFRGCLVKLDMKPHQYDKLLQSARGKIVARLEKNVFANNSDLLGQ